MTRIGLVLGAGGFVGQAYHAGVLAALEAEVGWDPRTADIVVGSSAGSLTGAALRLGVPASDLVASALGEPLSAEGGFLAAFDAEGPDIAPIDPRHILRGWRLPPRRLVARTARRPWDFRAAAAAAAVLPPGRVDITGPADALAPHLGDTWPEGLWICAARRDSGKRIVFGRSDAPPAPLGRAVAASCAIPGWFTPVEIGGIDYVDGGVHSPTNADVLVRERLDLVIVSSPMSAAHGRTRGPDAGVRWALHRRLDQEVARLRKAGTTVVRIEPGRQTRSAMGINAMDPERVAPVAASARDDVARYLAGERIAERLAVLGPRPAGSVPAA